MSGGLRTCHDDTEELFLVLSGELTIQMRDRNVVLGALDLFVVPRGAEHCPRADTETAVLLLEPQTSGSSDLVSVKSASPAGAGMPRGADSNLQLTVQRALRQI